MDWESEPHKPNPETLELIRRCAGTVYPESPELREWFDGYVTRHARRIGFDYDLICRHVSTDSRILEVGAVPLLLTVPLKESGYSVTGLDIKPDRFASAIQKTGLTVLPCDIETEPIPAEDNTFDAVIFNEIFEHLRINLIFTMRQVLRVLKPGGLMFLSTPNLRSLNGIRNFLIRKQSTSICSDLYEEYLKLETLGHMGHVREYTDREVNTFLRKVGFVPRKIVYRDIYEEGWKNCLIHRLPRFRPLFTLIVEKPGTSQNQV